MVVARNLRLYINQNISTNTQIFHFIILTTNQLQT